MKRSGCYKFDHDWLELDWGGGERLGTGIDIKFQIQLPRTAKANTNQNKNEIRRYSLAFISGNMALPPSFLNENGVSLIVIIMKIIYLILVVIQPAVY